MNIKELEYFLQVCEYRSINKAAQSLFISPQGLSKIIQRMENELEKPLLLRTQLGVELTAEGKVFEKHSRKILDQMGTMNREIEKISHESTKLTVASSYGILGHLGPELVFEFRNKYPGIQLEFKEFADKETTNAVWYDEADIGLTFAPVDFERFHVITLKKDELYLLVNRKNPLSLKKKIFFKDLKEESFILENEQFNLHQTVLKRCNEAGFIPNVIFETGAICLCRDMVSNGYGISVGTKTLLKEPRPQEIIIAFEPPCAMPIVAITKKDDRITSDIKLFLKFIELKCAKM